MRHLQTQWNTEGRLQGSNDIPIIGGQAPDRFSMELLQKTDFDVIVTSTLQRTRQTAEKYGIKNYIQDPLINELNFGKFEGRPKEELLEEFGSEWLTDIYKVKLGEPILGFENRLLKFILKFIKCEKVLLFGHGAVIRALYAISIYSSIEKMNMERIDNGEIKLIYF